MNDYQMIHLAADRGHQFQREAAQDRLARSATRTSASRAGSSKARPDVSHRTLRLTLAHLLGRTSA